MMFALLLRYEQNDIIFFTPPVGNLPEIEECLYLTAKGSWSKTHIFAASTITQYWLGNSIVIFFISDNATIIYWMNETNSCFLRIASKAPLRIQQNLYTAFEWIRQINLNNFIFPWRVPREKMKIKVSSV